MIKYILLTGFLSILAVPQGEGSPVGGDSTEMLITEKVYLHLDRRQYSAGEDVWFRAYLVDGDLGILIDHSRVLYVELISPARELVDRKRIRLDGGTGSGDLHLGDSLSPGQYTVRAYTNWMRNFGHSFIFSQTISLLDQGGLAGNRDTGEYENRAEAVTRKETDPSESTDLQFFPEGGSMIAGVAGRIGVKAVDGSGKGCRARGFIVDSSGDTVARFKSSHLGMGSFYFLPRRNRGYRAYAFLDGGPRGDVAAEYAFPRVLDTGFALQAVNGSDGNKLITIQSNKATLEAGNTETLYLEGRFGSSNFLARIDSAQTEQSLVLPGNSIPHGLVNLILYDKDFKPLGERLIFNDIGNRSQLRILTDKSESGPREQVNLEIIMNAAGDSVPAGQDPASISVSAIRKTACLDRRGLGTNILSWLLLESEIRGYVEDPGYYFDPGNKDRLEKLDLLLLTQGWRDYAWKYLGDGAAEMSHPLETGIDISGTLSTQIGNKPIPEASISLLFISNMSSVLRLTGTDSAGSFLVPGLNLMGTGHLIVSAADKRGRSRGLLQLDSLPDNSAEIGDWVPCGLVSPPAYEEYAEDFRAKTRIKELYSLSDTIPIGEVTITARAKPKQDDGHHRIYGDADNVIEVQQEDAGYYSIFELLQGKVAGVTVSGSFPDYSVQIRGANSFSSPTEPLFLLDGMPVDMEVIAHIPVSVVDKIEVLKTAASSAMFGARGAGGVISIFRKTGDYQPYMGDPGPWFVNRKVTGFHQARVFYSPRYPGAPETRKPDLRTTIHWEPVVRTDRYGRAGISFFNSDQPGLIVITAEGISPEGIPLYGKTVYLVK